MEGYILKGNRTSEELTPPVGGSSVMSTIIKQIVDKNDKDTMEMIKNYAKEYSNKKGQDVQVMFLDKDIVEEIIELGLREYRRKHG